MANPVSCSDSSPKAISLIAISPTTGNHPKRSGIKHSLTKSSILLFDSITDCHNKSQINEAVTQGKTLQERLKVVDMILERRKELEDMEHERKLERAAPLLKNLTKKFLDKIRKKQTRVPQNHFAKTLKSLTFDLPEGQSPTIAFTPLAPSLSVDPFENFERQSPATFQTTLGDFERPSIGRSIINNQSEKIGPVKKRKDFLKQNSLLKKTPKTVFDSAVGLIHSQNNEETNTVADLETLKKQSAAKKVRLSSIKVAHQKFENDLVRFMVESKEEDPQSLLFTEAVGKVPKMVDIEKKAQNRFETLRKTASTPTPAGQTLPKVSSLGKSYTIEVSKLPRVEQHSKTLKPGASKRIMTVNNPEGRLTINKGGDSEMETVFEDESFASYTEATLVDMYRNTRKFNTNIKRIDNELEYKNTKENYGSLKTWELENVNNLQQTSKDVMRLTRKKLEARGV